MSSLNWTSVRVLFPKTTVPLIGGDAAAAASSCFFRSAALAMPATRMTRRPPAVGTLNGCERSVSPSTVASAIASPPRGSALNSARPWASVVAVKVFCPTLMCTCWPAMLLPIDSRTTRTVTVPFGRSPAGIARPLISDGSGMS
jgi:hypothetical protein